MSDHGTMPRLKSSKSTSRRKFVEPKSGEPAKVKHKAHDTGSLVCVVWHIQDDVIMETRLVAIYGKVDDADANISHLTQAQASFKIRRP